LLPSSGRLDLAAMRGAMPAVAEADSAVREVRDRILAVPTSGLVPTVQDAVSQLRAELDRLVEAISAVRRSGALLPALLGGNGTRTYLAVFQNLAEPRATGGIFGAYAVIRASKGEVKLVKQGPVTDLSNHGQPPLSLSRELRALYTDLPGIYPADVNLTPHFPTAATLIRQMYRRAGGGTIDGVLATDPVALSYLLKAIGPVSVPGHPTLTASTAVRTLLSDAYRRIDEPAQQDKYFAASARAVFDALLKRSVNPRAVVQAVNTAVAERRILFWSAHQSEQRELVDTRLAGVLPERETVHNVGVFLNDGSGAKLGYYLDRSATAARTVAGNSTSGSPCVPPHPPPGSASRCAASRCPATRTPPAFWSRYSARYAARRWAPGWTAGRSRWAAAWSGAGRSAYSPSTSDPDEPAYWRWVC
jgi:hypothetical protein